MIASQVSAEDTANGNEQQADKEHGLKSNRALSPSVETSEVAGRHRESMPGWQWPGTVAIICMLLFMYGYDTSNAANIQAPVYEALGHIEILPWIVLGFSVGNVALVPLFRKLMGIFNLKYLLAASLVFYATGAAVSGAATSMPVMIVGRSLIGVGCVGNYQVGMTYLAIFGRPDEIRTVMSMVGATYSIGLLCGPFIGGAFAENLKATWRWAFYINIPFTAIGAASLVVFPKYKAPNTTPLAQQLASVDWVGALLHACSVALFYIALTLPGASWSWSSGSTIAVWAVWGVFFISYIMQQYFHLLTTAEDRILPIRIAGHRVMRFVLLGVASISMAHGIALYYTPLLLAFTRGLTPLGTALRILPYIGLFIVFSIVTGRALGILGRYDVFLIAAGALAVVGSVLMTTITLSSSDSAIMGYLVLIGAAAGSIFPHGLSIAGAVLPANELPDALVLIVLAQTAGIGIAVAMAGCVFENVGFNYLQDVITRSNTTLALSDHDIRTALAGVASRLLSGDDRALTQLVLQAVTKLITQIFYIALAGGAICFALGLLMTCTRVNSAKGSKDI